MELKEDVIEALDEHEKGISIKAISEKGEDIIEEILYDWSLLRTYTRTELEEKCSNLYTMEEFMSLYEDDCFLPHDGFIKFFIVKGDSYYETDIVCKEFNALAERSLKDFKEYENIRIACYNK